MLCIHESSNSNPQSCACNFMRYKHPGLKMRLKTKIQYKKVYNHSGLNKNCQYSMAIAMWLILITHSRLRTFFSDAHDSTSHNISLSFSLALEDMCKERKMMNVRKFSVRYPCSPVSHYSDVIMGAMASQITSLTIVYLTVYSGADQRKHHKAPRHWPLCGEFTGDQWIPRTNGK